MKTRLLALSLALGLAAAQPAGAHHSFAAFDQTKKITLVGTIKEFQWANPHSWIIVMVPNAQGVEEQWAIECAGPTVLSRFGWKPKGMKPGDKVTIVTHPLRSGEKGGEVVSVLLPSGQTLLHG